MRSRVLAAVALLTLVAGGACRGGGDDGDRGEGVRAASAPTTRELPSRVEITATGAADVAFAADVPFTVSRFEPANRDLRLLTVGLGQFVPLPDGRRVRLAVDLAGMYDGPGTYRFGGSAAGAPGAVSAAFVHLVDLHDPNGSLDPANVARTVSFDRLVAPCTLETADDERTGRMHCPRLASADGSELDVVLNWETA